MPGRANGRERWWRTFPVDLREPDYDSLGDGERAALDEWRAGQIPGELELVNRFIRDVREHGKWAKASRAGGYYTVADLEALHDDYVALLHKYGHAAQDAPPGARPMQLRMFYIPDEPSADAGRARPPRASRPPTVRPLPVSAAADESRPHPAGGRYSQRGCPGPCREPCGG